MWTPHSSRAMEPARLTRVSVPSIPDLLARPSVEAVPTIGTTGYLPESLA
jgi:hypothetical protein